MTAGPNKKLRLPHWKRTVLNRFKEIKYHPDFEEDMQKIYDILHASDNMSIKELVQDLKVCAGLEKGISRDTLVTINLRRLLNKYEAPGGMYELLKQYLLLMSYAEEDGMDMKTINENSLLNNLTANLNFPPIFLVSPSDNTVLMSDDSPYNMEVYKAYLRQQGKKRVYLELTANVQLDDLVDYVRENYKNIEAKLEPIAPGRIKRTSSKQNLKRDYKIIGLYKKFSNDPKYKRRIYQTIHNKMNEGHKNELYKLETIEKVIKHYRKQKRLWDVLMP